MKKAVHCILPTACIKNPAICWPWAGIIPASKSMNSTPLNIMKHRTWVNLAVFENKTDADALTAFLQNAKFEARSYNDRVLQMLLFLCPPRATYRVQVREDSFKPASNFIQNQSASSLILQRAIKCPSCESLAVQYPQMTRKFLTPTILLHIGILLRIVDHQAYCEHCHCLWPLFSRRQVVEPRPGYKAG